MSGAIARLCEHFGHDLWYQISQLSQHTAIWDQFTPRSHSPHGYMDGWGPGLLSTSPLSNCKIRVLAQLGYVTNVLWSLYGLVKYPLLVHRLWHSDVDITDELILIWGSSITAGVSKVLLRMIRLTNHNSRTSVPTRCPICGPKFLWTAMCEVVLISGAWYLSKYKVAHECQSRWW